MAVRVMSWLSRPSLLRTLILHARLSLRLLRDPEVSAALKALPVAAAFYIVSPVDFLPDVLPVVGQLDDFALLLLALETFLKLSPARVVNFHRGAMAEGRRYSPSPHPGDVIDAEFRRADER